MYELSVIVPVYKTKDYLCDCVDSILSNQANMEIILVDDGSPDDCGKICDDFAKRFGNIKVIHKENGGLSSARNAGLDMAQGNYLAFVDSDDMADSSMLSKMLDTIKMKKADIVCCSMKILGTETLYLDAVNWQDEYDRNDCIELLISPNGTGDFYMNKMFRRELFSDIRLPVGKYYEDIFSMYKVFDKAKKVVCIKEPLYLYRIHGQSISHSTEFNPKIIDYAYACQAEWSYVKDNRAKYTDMATAKYANAINQLSKKPSILYGKSEEAKKCFSVLKKFFLQDIVSITENEYCSERLKYEISLMLRSKALLKRYLWRLGFYNSLHNHPRLQGIVYSFLNLPELETKKVQY